LFSLFKKFNPSLMLIKRALLVILVFFAPWCIFGQITTSSITGSVKDEKNQILPGATITAIHTPTGSTYTTTLGKQGIFNLPNLRVGGPYKVTVTYVGFEQKVFEDINLTLGTPLTLDAVLSISGTTLTNVVVTTNSRGIISSKRNGTSTNISQRMIQGIPSINRSVQDFARLTPQVKVGNDNRNGNSTGLSFAGQSNRYNQFSIDGANASDAFGLGSSGTNGGQANVNPISIEAIQEMQIVLSPYDVTQGGFTGGGINAVTKSGTNTFHGSAYGQYQNDSWIGKSPAYNEKIERKPYGEFKNKTYGASVGGAIIKNKLFFFGSVERFQRSTPLAFDPTAPGSGSKLNVDTLEAIRNNMIKTGFDPGTYGALNNNNKSTSFFARVDWNISDKHKLTLRHNYVDGSNDVLSRTATTATFSNGGYKFTTNSNSSVIELNSNFSSGISNVLRLTYNRIRDARVSAFIPNIAVYNYDTVQKATILYNLGSDFSSAANSLDQDILSITDNFTLYKGKHTLTFGTNNEFFSSKNVFIQGFYGAYTYGASGTTTRNNLNNFFTNTGLTTYQIGFSAAGRGDKAIDNLKAAQLAVYGQDIFSINKTFKLTYGLRIDLPVISSTPAENEAFNSAFAAYGVSTNQKPKTTPLFSPRAGFNWDVKGDATTQLRGGAGLFTGRVPFVWVSNQLGNTGVAKKNVTYNATQIATAGIKYNYDPNDPQAGAYVPTFSAIATAINVIDKNFKFPQVFRANLALDRRLFWGLVGTFEAVYSKTINNANYKNLNISENGEGRVTLGSTTRPLWTKWQNANYQQVILLTNTSQGNSYTLTAQVQKPLTKGWAGSIAYTYGHATSLTDVPSSVALSNWRGVQSLNGLNNPELSNSNFDLGSRIISYVSKEFRYAKNIATSFTLIYTGQSGQRISYVYSGNVLGDDVNNNSASTALAYIPASLSESNFVDISGGATASQQWADFQSYAESNKYLKDHMGQNTKRNADRLPFEHHFDFRISQDFNFKLHKLSLFFDVVNIGNLLNKDWGWSYASTGDGFFPVTKTLFTTLTSGAQKKDGVAYTPTAATPAFQFNINNSTNINNVYRPYDLGDFTSRWSSQIGLRYSF
jgi:hypothetical protein